MIDRAVLLFDHAGRDAAPAQVDGECEPDRAAADDEHRNIDFAHAGAFAHAREDASLPAPHCSAMPAPHVYLDYDQAQLDACYDQTIWAANHEQMRRRQAALSDIARKRLAPAQRHAYGSGAMEHLDVYRTAQANAPVFVFVHGGAWKANSSERYAFAAEAFVAAGAHFVLLDFDGVEATEMRLLPIVDQVRRAIAWVYNNAVSFGGDPARIHVGGHSSGAHLTGCVLLTDWSAYGVPATPLAGAMCCSGMYDLAPVRLSARSSYVHFDDEMVDALSALRHLERINLPLVLVYGTEESPEFQRQSRDFAAALTAAGKRVQLLVGEGFNHFEIAETLGNPYGLLGHAALQQMQLAR
jgi:arylformamidase